MQPDKRETVSAFVAKGETLLILDPRQPGVQVPRELAALPELRLKVSYRYDTGALLIDDEGVRQTLAFSGRTFVCVVPWSALIAALCFPSQEGCGWDRPPEPEARPARRSFLRVVNGELLGEPETEQPDTRPAHLRLVH